LIGEADGKLKNALKPGLDDCSGQVQGLEDGRGKHKKNETDSER